MFYYLEGVISIIGIFAILSMSLNMISGVTGLLQLGQSGFFAIGAYTAGILALYGTIPALGNLNLVISLVGAVVLAMIFAIIFGLPCMRLKGDYLAIVTLGFAETLRLLLNNIIFPGSETTNNESFGGPTGLEWPDMLPESAKWVDNPDYSAMYATVGIIWILVLGSYLLLVNLKNSALGRNLMCIREDEIAAKSLGINVTKHKMIAFVISAAFAGFAGALFFHHELAVNPNDFTLLLSIEVLLIVVFGGLGSFSGALVAAVILKALPEILRFVHLSEYRQILYAMLLIALIRIAPQGIFGMKEFNFKFFASRAKAKLNK